MNKILKLLLFQGAFRARMRIFTTLFLCAPLLSGCWDAQELEHMFYVHALGVDFEGGKYVVYTQILNPNALSKESSKSEEQIGAWIGRGIGISYEDAIHNLYATTQRKVYWGHMDAVVFSERLLATRGIQETLDILTRYPEVRYTSWVFCTSDDVSKVLSVQPILESSPVYSVLSDPNDLYNQSSFIEPKRLHRLIARLQEPGLPSIIPELSMKEDSWFDAKTQHPEINLSGYGLIRNGRLVGTLSRDSLSGMRWFLPYLPRAVVSIMRDGRSIATVTISHRKRHVRSTIVNGQPRYDVQLDLVGSIVQMAHLMPEAQMESMVSRTVEEEIRQTYESGVRYGVDIYALADTLYRRNPGAFHHYATHDGQVIMNEDGLRTIEVKVRLHDMGKTMEPAERYTT